MSSRGASEIQPWSLGAILAAEEIDERTYLLVVRPDAGLSAALDLRRRLLGARLAGYRRVIVQLVHGHLSDPVLASLMNGARRLELRSGRLVAAAQDPAVRIRLANAGIELADEDG